MKRVLGIILALAVLAGAFPAGVYGLTKEPTIEAKSAILVDMTTGDVLMEKEADERRYPASTTKIMTCLLALEKLDLESDITVDAEAASTGGNSIKLKEGEVMNAGVMLHAMMIPSANDCAVAIAKYASGSVDSFAAAMNEKAKELGCRGTNFVNPNGLHDENHYTTARDLSLIALEAMKNPDFREIVRTVEYTVPATNKSAERTLTNTNLLLNDTQNKNRIYVGNDLRYCKYEGTIGIKTGYTSQAMGCLVAAAERDGTTLLLVVMGSSDLGRFADAIKLFEWGFANYKTYTVLHGGYSFGEVKVRHGEFNKVEAVLLTDVAYTLPKDASVDIMSAQAVLEERLTAPVKKGDVVGTVKLYEGDEPVGEYQAVAAKSVKVGGFLSIFGIEDATAKVIKNVATVVLVILAVVLGAYVGVMRKKTKIKKARKAKKLKEKQAEDAAKRAEWERYYEGSKYRKEEGFQQDEE